MDFNLNNLVSSRVLDPCTPFPENLQQPEMRHIAVFEPENPGFCGGPWGTDAAVYPHGCLCRLTADTYNFWPSAPAPSCVTGTTPPRKIP